MKVFCPNCGSENEGLAGGRVVCRACTATFEVPAERMTSQAEPPVSTPSVPQYATPSQQQPAPVVLQGVVQQQTNVLAIVSLVTSLLCCSPAGLITGFIGLQQINQSNGQQKGKELAIIGMVIGALGLCSSGLYFLALIAGTR